MGTPLSIGRAFNPGDRGSAAGSDHIIVGADYSKGRLRRTAGDALCKRREKFWGLYPNESGSVSPCKRCTEIARRHGLSAERWPLEAA